MGAPSRHEGDDGQLGQHGTLVDGSASRFFMVVDKHPTRKKLMPLADLEKQRAMSYPVPLQWVRACHSDGGDLSQPGQHAVALDGAPEVVDLMELASWSVLHRGMYKWRIEGVDSGVFTTARGRAARGRGD